MEEFIVFRRGKKVAVTVESAVEDAKAGRSRMSTRQRHKLSTAYERMTGSCCNLDVDIRFADFLETISKESMAPYDSALNRLNLQLGEAFQRCMCEDIVQREERANQIQIPWVNLDAIRRVLVDMCRVSPTAAMEALQKHLDEKEGTAEYGEFLERASAEFVDLRTRAMMDVLTNTIVSGDAEDGVVVINEDSDSDENEEEEFENVEDSDDDEEDNDDDEDYQ